MRKTFEHEFKQVFEKVQKVHINNLIKSKNKKTYWFGLSSTQLIYYIAYLIFTIKNKKDHKRINFLINDFEKRIDKKNFKRNSIKSVYFLIKNFINSIPLNYKKNIYLLGNADEEINTYKKENSLVLKKIDPWIRINLNKYSYFEKDDFFENILKLYIEDLIKVFRIKKKHIKEIEIKIKKKFHFFYNCYCQMILLYKNQSFDLISSKHVFIWNRIFFGALNYLGNFKTITVNHGLSGITNMKPSFIDDGAFIGKYQLLTTRHYLKNYKNIFKELKFSRKLKPIFLKKNPIFNIQEKKFRPIIREKKINQKEKLIILGYPKTIQPDINSPYQSISLSTKFEINLIDCLNKKYDVYYNSHPDRKEDTKKLFKNIPNVLFEKYEDIYREFDISFFTYHRSTAFGFALLKGVPCVMIYNKESEMTNLTRNYLSKRVSFINTITTNKPSIIFDKKKIISSVEKSKKLSNYDLIKKLKN